MSIQFWILLVCGFVLYNMYYETNVLKNLTKYKKYYKMAIVVAFGLGALKIVKSSPTMSYENMKTLNQFIQYMPMDRESKDLLTPFLSSCWILDRCLCTSLHIRIIQYTVRVRTGRPKTPMNGGLWNFYVVYGRPRNVHGDGPWNTAARHVIW